MIVVSPHNWWWHFGSSRGASRRWRLLSIGEANEASLIWKWFSSFLYRIWCGKQRATELNFPCWLFSVVLLVRLVAFWIEVLRENASLVLGTFSREHGTSETSLEWMSQRSITRNTTPPESTLAKHVKRTIVDDIETFIVGPSKQQGDPKTKTHNRENANARSFDSSALPVGTTWLSAVRFTSVAGLSSSYVSRCRFLAAVSSS